MSTLNNVKKSHADWHRADIIAALRKKGWTFSRLSRHHGYSRTALKNALDSAWPHAQMLIAEKIGVEPWDIWPSRYKNGRPASGRRVRGGKRASLHISTGVPT